MSAVGPPPVTSLHDLALALGELRTLAGAPSFAELARRVGALRLARGSSDAPGKVTVYDCFRIDRQRVDAELIHDLVLALGADHADALAWRAAAARVTGAALGGQVAAVVLPAVVAEGAGPEGAEVVAAGGGVGEAAVAPVVVLTGLPGVGKTELARGIAELERAAGRADRVVRIRLHGFEDGERPAEPVAVLRELLRALDRRPDRRLHAAALRDDIALAVRERGVVVLLEDAASAGQLAPLLIEGTAPTARAGGWTGLRLVITSRSRLDGLDELAATARLGVDRRLVHPLAPTRTAQLITTATRSRRVSSTPEADERAIARLAEAIGGIRLDLDLVLGFIDDHPDWSLTDVADRFGDRSRRDHAVPLVEPSLAALDPEAVRLFRRLGLLRGPVRLDVLDVLVAPERASDRPAPEPTTAALVQRLAAMHLVTEEADTVVMHPLVHTAAGRLALEHERPSSLLALAEALLARFAALIREGGEGRVDASLADGVTSAAGFARAHGATTTLARTVLDVVEVVGDAGYWSHAAELLQLAAPVVEPDRRGAVAELLARAFEKLGRYDDALDQLHRASRLSVEEQPGRMLNVIGNVQRQLGRMAEAERSYLQAARTATASGNAVTRGRALGNLANLARITSRYRRSAQLFDLADTVSARAGDEVNRTIVASNRVLLLAAQGSFDEALTSCQTLIARNGAGVNLGYLHVQRAMILLDLDRVDDAEAALIAAADGDGGPTTFDEDAEIAIHLAQVARRKGETVEAERLARIALDAAEDVGYPILLTDASSTLGEVAADAGDAEAAERWARASLERAEQLADRVEQARSLETLARAALIRGDRAAAARTFDDAHRLLGEVGHWRAANCAELAASVRRELGV